MVSDIHKIKSRAVQQNDFFIGDGKSERAFVHLSVLLLKGRSEELKQRLSQTLHRCLKAAFPQTAEKMICDFTVSVEDIDASVYMKDSNFQMA